MQNHIFIKSVTKNKPGNKTRLKSKQNIHEPARGRHLKGSAPDIVSLRTDNSLSFSSLIQDNKHNLALFVIFLIGALMVYFKAINGGFVWDDNHYVGVNIQLRSPGGLWRIWTELGAVAQYYPMVFSSFWLEYHIWQLATPGYHLVNIALHAANATLLYCLLKKVKPGIAFAVATIFLLHPVMVESVAWITERKNTLSMFFYLCSFLCLLPAVLSRENHDSPSITRFLFGLSWQRYICGLIFFVFALLSKTTACTLPATLLVLAWYFNGRPWGRRIPIMIPLFISGLLLAAVTVYTERVIVGSTESGVNLSLSGKFLVAGRALWFYAGKLLWPWPTMFVYPRWQINSHDAVQYIWPLAAVVVLGTVWAMRRRIGRGPAVAMFIYAGTLLPALGFVNVYPFKFSFVADHFQYLAAPAFLALVCGILLKVIDHYKVPAIGVRAVFAVILIALAALTSKQAAAYQSAELLYRDTIAKNNGASMPHNNLGEILAKKDDVVGAEKEYLAAIKAEPDMAGAYFNLGEIQLRTGRTVEGNLNIQKALSLSPDDPRLYFHTGLAYAKQHDADKSISCFQKAIELKPNYVDPVIELGNIYGQTNHPDQAREAFAHAVAMKPDSAIAHANLANALASLGQIDQAIESFQRSLNIDPAAPQTWLNYSMALQSAGRTEESLAARHKAEELAGREAPAPGTI